MNCFKIKRKSASINSASDIEARVQRDFGSSRSQLSSFKTPGSLPLKRPSNFPKDFQDPRPPFAGLPGEVRKSTPSSEGITFAATEGIPVAGKSKKTGFREDGVFDKCNVHAFNVTGLSEIYLVIPYAEFAWPTGTFHIGLTSTPRSSGQWEKMEDLRTQQTTQQQPISRVQITTRFVEIYNTEN